MPSKTYHCWRNLRRRCDDPSNNRYSTYGARGITYCDRWKSYENFLEDMGRKPEGMVLDRIDNDGPYCKENCRWATLKQSANNKGIQRNNTSGVTGVSQMRQDLWRAYAGSRGSIFLYEGPSFEEACRARKVWEETKCF